MKNKSNINSEILSAIHRGSRETEIEMFGKTISHFKIFRNKKSYTRKTKHKKEIDLF